MFNKVKQAKCMQYKFSISNRDKIEYTSSLFCDLKAASAKPSQYGHCYILVKDSVCLFNLF